MSHRHFVDGMVALTRCRFATYILRRHSNSELLLCIISNNNCKVPFSISPRCVRPIFAIPFFFFCILTSFGNQFRCATRSNEFGAPLNFDCCAMCTIHSEFGLSTGLFLINFLKSKIKADVIVERIVNRSTSDRIFNGPFSHAKLVEIVECELTHEYS